MLKKNKANDCMLKDQDYKYRNNDLFFTRPWNHFTCKHKIRETRVSNGSNSLSILTGTGSS